MAEAQVPQEGPVSAEPAEGLAVYDAPPPDVTFYWVSKDQLDQLVDPRRDHNIEGKWTALGITLASLPTTCYEIFKYLAQSDAITMYDVLHFVLFVGGAVAFIIYKGVVKRKVEASDALKNSILSQRRRRVQ